MNEKILILENQYSQFLTIRNAIKDDFSVLPDEPLENFKHWMDNVRIAVNAGYGSITNPNSYAAERFDFLCNLINEYSPNVILMDHILVDSQNSVTGIELTRAFRRNGIDTYVIFFSSSSLNDPDIVSIESSVQNCCWLSKGLSKEENLSRRVLYDFLKPKIKKAIAHSRNDEMFKLINFKESVSRIRHFSGINEIKVAIDDIIAGRRPNDIHALISEWEEGTRKDEHTLQKIAKSYHLI